MYVAEFLSETHLNTSALDWESKELGRGLSVCLLGSAPLLVRILFAHGKMNGPMPHGSNWRTQPALTTCYDTTHEGSFG